MENSYHGVVQAVDKDDDNPNVIWWLVVYEDGDEEHLELQEVLDILDFGEESVKPTANKERKLPQPKKKKVTASKVESELIAETEAENLFKELPTMNEACPCGAAELLCGSPKKDTYCVDIQKMIDVAPALNTQFLNYDFTRGPEADFTTLENEEEVDAQYLSSDDEEAPKPNDPDVLFQYADVFVKREDLRRLESNDWLNDRLVDFGMHFELDRAEASNVSLVSTFFYSYGTATSKHPKRYYLRPNCLYGNPAKSTTSARRLKPMSEVTLIPINQTNSHWTLILLIKQCSLDNVKLVYLDSLGGMWFQPCHMIKDLCEKKFGVNVEIIQGQLGKLQGNDYDCGVFLIKWTTLIAKFATKFKGNMFRDRSIQALYEEIKRYGEQYYVSSRRAILIEDVQRYVKCCNLCFY